jgi:fatty-acyl-CoA synthase
VYGHYPAVIHGAIRRDWRETYARCRRLASALAGRGIGRGDTVAVMLPNIPAMLEAHFGVPMIGAVLNTLNVRLDAEAIAFMLRHGEAKVLITDREFHGVIREPWHARTPAAGDRRGRPGIRRRPAGQRPGLRSPARRRRPDFAWEWPEDEWQAISLNYTSGTTGNPKGVVSPPRRLPERPGQPDDLGHGPPPGVPVDPADVPLQRLVLPLDHHRAGRHPRVPAPGRPAENPHLIREHRVSHLCGAPIVLNALVNMPDAAKAAIEHPVQAMVAGAAPPAKVIGAVEEMGIKVTHVYGLTEVYGPVTVCAWHDEWDALPWMSGRGSSRARACATRPWKA